MGNQLGQASLVELFCWHFCNTENRVMLLFSILVTHLDVRRAVDGMVWCLLLVLLRAVWDDHEESKYIDNDIIRNDVNAHIKYELREILMLYS